MPNIDLDKIRSLRVKQAESRDAASGRIARRAERIRGLDVEIARAHARRDEAGAAGGIAERKRLVEEQARAWEDLRSIEVEAGRKIESLERLLDPCSMPSASPLLLLPVRVETKFKGDRQLRVRIYPDEIHLDRLERGLSNHEREAGQAFWTAGWNASDDDYAMAWRAFVAQVGRRRARWIANATRPLNLDHRGTADAPEFPAAVELAAEGTVARLLPDRFVVVAVQGDKVARAHGKSVPQTLRMGLFADEAERLEKVNGVWVCPASRWIVDYEAAAEVGMAVTLDLATAGKIDHLFVYGVRRGVDPVLSAEQFGQHLQARAMSGELSFVAQGTPSNNTEQGRSGAARHEEDAPPPRTPDEPPTVKSNAQALAQAMGIDPQVFARVPGAHLREGAWARASNALLWRASWGTLLDLLPAIGGKWKLTDQQRGYARSLHRDRVWGRGPLPAIRVGAQPYGVLPVGATDKQWKQAGDDGELLGLLRKIRDHWRKALPKVERVPMGGDRKLPETMFALLGNLPVSIGVFARMAVSGTMADMEAKTRDRIDSDDEARQLLRGLAWETLGSYAEGLPPPELDKRARPVTLPLTDASDKDYLRALKAGRRGVPKSILQALVALGWTRLKEAGKSAPDTNLVKEMVEKSTQFDAAIRNSILDDLDSGRTRRASDFERRALDVAARLDPEASLQKLQPVMALRQEYADMYLAATSNQSAGYFAGNGVLDWYRLNTEDGDFAEAIDELCDALDSGALDSEGLAILVGESLDIASHRLDAWITGLVESQRSVQRTKKPGELCLGAFGWVEDIRPSQAKAFKPGYLHAPTATQAVTAGILRSAYNTHNGAQTGAFAIDLTSARTRDAIDLIEGMREGQSLSALVGYRIERSLHDDALQRFTLLLRREAPLVEGRLTDRGASLPDELREVVATSNVVDGIALCEQWADVDGDRKKIIAALEHGPKDNRYTLGINWVGPSDTELEKLGNAIERARASLDAVADVLMAESVHQLAQGNMSRAAAALDAASNGDTIVPIPQVTSTPADGRTVTHKLAILGAPGISWAPTQPRAAAEPALEAWAARTLGDPASIVVALKPGRASPWRFDQTGLCALDLVYGSVEPDAFARRVRARLGLPADAVLAKRRDPAWPAEQIGFEDALVLARAMRGVLAPGRPLTGEDLSIVPGREGGMRTGYDGAIQRVEAAIAELAKRRDSLSIAIAGQEASAMDDAMDALQDFGVAAPPPHATKSRHEDLARLCLDLLDQRLSQARQILEAIDQTGLADAVRELANVLFGDGFHLLPDLHPGEAGDEVRAAMDASPADATPSQIRRWLADYGSARAGVGAYAGLVVTLDALGRKPGLQVAQMFTEGEHPPVGWLGASRVHEPGLDCAVTSIVLDARGVDGASGAPFRGLELDHFHDQLPASPTQDSALALNLAASSSRPPQTLLFAVPPDGGDWSSDKLQAVLSDTAELAKLRAVRLEHTAFAGQILPALFVQSHSLQGEEVMDIGALLQNANISAELADHVAVKLRSGLQFIKEQP